MAVLISTRRIDAVAFSHHLTEHKKLNVNLILVLPVVRIATHRVHHATVPQSHNASTANRIDSHSRESVSTNAPMVTMATKRERNVCLVRLAVRPVAAINASHVNRIGLKTKRTNVLLKAVTIAMNVSKITDFCHL